MQQLTLVAASCETLELVVAGEGGCGGGGGGGGGGSGGEEASLLGGGEQVRSRDWEDGE